MSQNAAIALTVGLIAVGAAIMFWLMSRSERKQRARAAAASEKFEKRLASPDLDGLERHLGHALPASFCAMYQDRDLIMSDNILIGVPNPLENDDECYVAWFQPADTENIGAAWPGCDGLFPIADDGAGDQFLVDLRQPDPEVIYHLHETAERRGLGVSLSAFLAAPRRPVTEA
jgi:hypothetical protein